MDKEERKKYIFAQLRSLPNATQYVEVTKYIENLEQQVKKQKEVINKAIEYINSSDISIDIRKTDGSLDYVSINELLNILRGGSK